MNITVTQGNIVDHPVEVIVNAANSDLRVGSGVCAAIHAAAGPELEELCNFALKTWGRTPPGEVTFTLPGNLSARFVCHAVAPIYHQTLVSIRGAMLMSVYTRAIGDSAGYRCKSIAFPALGTGVYGWPKLEAAKIAVSVARMYQAAGMDMDIVFVAYDDETFDIYSSLLELTDMGNYRPHPEDVEHVPA